MKLTVLERLLLLNLLPEAGNLTTIRIVRELRESLSFTEDEHEVLRFETLPGGNVRWRSPDTWATFARVKTDDGVQWAMADGSFTFYGEWSEEKNAEYAAKCQELIGDGAFIQVGKRARQEVKEWLKKLDEKGEVREPHFSIFEKFELVNDLLDK